MYLKNINIRIILSGVCLMLAIYFASGIDTPKNNNDKTKKISWSEPVQEINLTIIPASIQLDFGKFNFRWVIENEKSAILTFLEPAGSAELALMEKKIFPMIFENGTTQLFQEFPSLLSEKRPVEIRTIAAVSTKDLFSVLKKKIIPQGSPVIKKDSSIVWNELSIKNNIKYLPGSIKASFGTLNIYWKKTNDRIPLLITIETPGAGELPPAESKLFIWEDKNGTMTICQERFPLISQGSASYLVPLVKVKSKELINGFNLLLN